jgi:antitoxin VapB
MARSINIKNDEVTALVAELTAATGKGTTELILELLRQEAEHRRKLSDVNKRRKRVDAILRRARKKIPKNAPPARDLIVYDKNGLPG